MKTYHLEKFKLNVDPNHIFKSTDIDIFYKTIKEEFFNPLSNKWSVSLFKQFITENNLDVKKCHSILEKFNEIYFQSNQKGSIGFNNFLLSISKIKEKSSSKINIKSNRLLFLEDLQGLRETHFPNISNETFIKFIDKNFTTDYTKSSLRSLFYEEGVSKKTSLR